MYAEAARRSYSFFPNYMQTEWEAAFWNIDKDQIRAKLPILGATLIYPERLMRRVNLFLPEGTALKGFARIRDEGDRITMTVKDMSGSKIEEQKEAEVVVDNFERAQEVLRALGCKDKNYQETRRELWHLNDTEVTIDEWPFIEPLVEIEGKSEEEVRGVAALLGFEWADAHFTSADKMYAARYGVEASWVNRGIPRLTFDMPNPFQKSQE